MLRVAIIALGKTELVYHPQGRLFTTKGMLPLPTLGTALVLKGLFGLAAHVISIGALSILY